MLYVISIYKAEREGERVAEGERGKMFSSAIPFDGARSRAENHRSTQKAADESYTYLLIKVKCIFSLSKHWTMSELAATASSIIITQRDRSHLRSLGRISYSIIFNMGTEIDEICGCEMQRWKRLNERTHWYDDVCIARWWKWKEATQWLHVSENGLFCQTTDDDLFQFGDENSVQVTR